MDVLRQLIIGGLKIAERTAVIMLGILLMVGGITISLTIAGALIGLPILMLGGALTVKGFS